MVAHITAGTAFDKRGRPFRRRNIMPGIIAAGVLAVVTAAGVGDRVQRDPPTCTRPRRATRRRGRPTPRQTALGQPVTRSTMTDVAPAKLADTKIRVLNASGQGGQAAEVAGALRDLGYAQPTAANDTVYANTRLTCQGQIRFGADRAGRRGGGVAGRAVHRAVSGRAPRRHRRPGDRHGFHRR